jgi:RNA polymerase sigma-70 factor (ECF subfamily)
MLQGLSATEAGIVRLYHLEGCTYREISAKLGIPENSIGPTLARAREKLRHASVAASR